MLLWLLLAALAAAAARRLFGGYRMPPCRLNALTAAEYATVAAASLASYPPGGAIGPSGLDARIPEHVDRFFVAQPPSQQKLMRFLFFLIEHATIVFPPEGYAGTRRFSGLSPEQQVEYLRGWQRSRLFPRRLAFTSLRAILTMGYFADPAVLRELGLAPRAVQTPTIEADGLWPAIGQSRSKTASQVVSTAAGRAEPLGPTGELHPDYQPASAPDAAR
jgi:hypothetical protein